MERWDSAMTTTPLIPNGLNSWKTTSTIVACARFAASMRELFTASRLLMDSESQSNNSRSRCRPKAFNPAASFRLRPSTAPLLQRAHRRRCYAAKKLAAAKNKVTVGSRKVDCKKKTRLDTFFDPAPAKFAARSPASHVALAVGAERHERAGSFSSAPLGREAPALTTLRLALRPVASRQRTGGVSSARLRRATRPAGPRRLRRRPT